MNLNNLKITGIELNEEEHNGNIEYGLQINKQICQQIGDEYEVKVNFTFKLLPIPFLFHSFIHSILVFLPTK